MQDMLHDKVAVYAGENVVERSTLADAAAQVISCALFCNYSTCHAGIMTRADSLCMCEHRIMNHQSSIVNRAS